MPMNNVTVSPVMTHPPDHVMMHHDVTSQHEGHDMASMDMSGHMMKVSSKVSLDAINGGWTNPL